MSSAKKIRKLGSLDTRAVALVGRGANKQRFAFAKSENDVSFTKLLVDIIEKDDMDDEEMEKALKKYGMNDAKCATAKGIMKLMGTYKDDDAFMKMMKEHLPKMFGEGDETDDEDDPTMTTETEKAEKLKKEEAERVAKAATDDAARSEMIAKADVDKMVQEQVAKAIEASQKATDAIVKSLQEEVKKQADNARLTEWVAKADRDLKYIPNQSAEQLGKMFFDLPEAIAQTQFTAMKAMSESMKSITKSRGFSGETPFAGRAGGEDAFQAVMKAAEPLASTTVAVVKSYDNLKLPANSSRIAKAAEYEAVTQALYADPSLYQAYLDQHPEQTSRGPQPSGN